MRTYLIVINIASENLKITKPKYPVDCSPARLEQDLLWSMARDIRFLGEFPRLAIYTKSLAEGPAFGVNLASRGNFLGNGIPWETDLRT